MQTRGTMFAACLVLPTGGKHSEHMAETLIILVADDEAPITALISDVLEDEGYTVQTVNNGASALLAIQLQPPALVMLDNAMPVMTGQEVLQRVRSLNIGIPIIMMSANAHGEIFLEAGADAFLPKPFDIHSLLLLVNQHLQANEH